MAHRHFEAGLQLEASRSELAAMVKYELAISHGHELAMAYAAKLYMDGSVIERDPYRAFVLQEMLAMRGYNESQYLVGTMYRNGEGVGQNGKQAVHWPKQAWYNNYDQAAWDVAEIYQGIIIDKNYSATREWYGNFYKKYEDADSAYQIGLLYKEGYGKFHQNLNKAMEWFMISKNADARYHLGLMFEEIQNYGAAKKWYAQAKDIDNPDALYNWVGCFTMDLVEERMRMLQCTILLPL